MKNIQIQLEKQDYDWFLSRYNNSTAKTYRDFLFELLNIYDRQKGIIMENKFMPQQSEKDKFDFAKYMKEERDIYNDLVDKGIKNISEGESLKNLLVTMMKLPNISINNLMALATQKGQVSELKKFNEWSKENVLVNKGEKALRMLKYQGEYTRKDGSIGRSYAVEKVFDVSQTNKDPDKTGWQINYDKDQLTNALIVMLRPTEVQIKTNLEAENILHYSNEDKAIIIERTDVDLSALHKELIKQNYSFNYPTDDTRQRLINDLSMYLNYSILGLPVNYPKTVEQYLAGKDKEEIVSFLTEAKDVNNMFLDGLEQCHQYVIEESEKTKMHEAERAEEEIEMEM